MSQNRIQLPFETNPNRTVTYEEAISFYEKLAGAFPGYLHLQVAGPTDIGDPLHVAIVSSGGIHDPASARKAGRLVLLINNGIHPGEPEGIDATILWLRDLLEKPEGVELLRHVVIVVIPVYNIDGCLNRGSFSRANQNGPEAYGFRGNARNLDLNRDFVKCDSRNARSFNKIFTTWMPDVFVDNHTSNGADYQYVMTLIATQHDKLEAPLGRFLHETMLPELYRGMKDKGWDMIPYVDGPGETPDAGISGFCDYGRYSTGFAALWNTIGFMPETHMLKPFAERVHTTYAFMDVVLHFMDAHRDQLVNARKEAFENTRRKSGFVLDWKMDTSRYDHLEFKGYAAKYKPSAVSGLPRLWYDRSEPFTKTIPYYNYFVPSVTVEKPAFYIIPQAWEPVLDRLANNGVVMQRLVADIDLELDSYILGNFQTREAWEGHYFHYNLKLDIRKVRRHFRKGDVVIPVDQDANRYLVETLEPHAPDSWFAWNYFDAALMQKEYFSAYVFEDLAAEFLKDHPEVRRELEARKAADPDFASDAQAQLDWVYRKSPWYEPSHRVYPVGRIPEGIKLPVAP